MNVPDVRRLRLEAETPIEIEVEEVTAPKKKAAAKPATKPAPKKK